MALLLQESRFAATGALASRENPDADRLALFFQAAQVLLGSAKNVRNGAIACGHDYDGRALEVARQKGSGLFAVRIDNLRCPKTYEICRDGPLANQERLLEPVAWSWGSDDSSCSDCENREAFVAADVGSLDIDPKVLKAGAVWAGVLSSKSPQRTKLSGHGILTRARTQICH
jgi:hypothetical protein